MAKMVKRFFARFKRIARIFGVKKHEMEIGYPTDVKHVAHIGLSINSVNAPSWMNRFQASTESSSASDARNQGQPWASSH